MKTAPAVLMVDTVSVTAGQYHACGLLSSGNATCWGDNTMNQLDIPPLDPPIYFRTISAGESHTCAPAHAR